ncbi:MAG: methyltransferase domain-containing protein [Acidobacteriota bacterium]
MNRDEIRETREFWDSVAEDWRIQVGDDGDSNRRLNSDPVLWAFAGDVRGRKVLDAGSGTGYLSRQMLQRGAMVRGVDFSARMIAIAQAHYPEIDFRVDSCSELGTVADGEVDLIVSNYVLMDTPDLEGTARAFYRVLRAGGEAVLVFSHPCFPQGMAASGKGDAVKYGWRHSYFERRKMVDAPWGHFKSHFIWFHRPLSEYFKAFRGAGFAVEDFEEPRISEERYHLAENEKRLRNNRIRPYSVVFRLKK